MNSRKTNRRHMTGDHHGRTARRATLLVRAADEILGTHRVTTLTGRLFHVRYTLRGTSYLLHRIGFTPQVPVHRAAERDEAKIAAWRAVTWAKVRG